MAKPESPMLSADEASIVVNALSVLEASVKRAINTERNANIREIRSNQLLAVQALRARFLNLELNLVV